MIVNQFEDRFASLEEASRLLSRDVSALNTTLMVVADLQRAQAEQEERQRKTEQAIDSAKTASAARDARTRRSLATLALGLAILLPVASILMYLALIGRVNQMLIDQRKGFFTSCQTRNIASRQNAEREVILARLEKDPQIARVHTDSAAALRMSLIDCSQYLRKP